MAVKRLVVALAAAPLALQAQIAAEAPVSRLLLAVEHDRLSNGYAAWTETALSASRQWQRAEVAEATLTQARRFGLTDTQAEVAYTRPLGPLLTASAQLSLSPTHHVLPRNSVGASLQYAFSPAWLLHTRLRHTRYSSSEVDQATLMLERYVGNYSASLAWRPVRALGVHASGLELRANRYYGQDSSIGLIAGAGREPTQLGADAITLAQVRSLALVGRHRVAPGWSVVYALHRTRQGDFYTRTGASAGAQHDF
jgi:YaiO family outer membrane protein